MRAFFLAGHRSDQVWSEFVVLPLSLGMTVDLETREFVWFVLMTVEADTGVQDIGQDLIKQLDEAFTALNGSLTAKAFSEWWQAWVLGKKEIITLTAGQILRDGKMSLVSSGGHGILVRRKQTEGWLVQPDRKGWQAVTGNYSAQDRWFVGTEALFRVLPAKLILRELGRDKSEESQGAIVSGLQQGGYEGVAGAVIDFGIRLDPATAEGEDRPLSAPIKTQELPTVFLHDKPRKRRQLAALGVLILGLLLVAVMVGGRRRAYLTEKNRFDITIAEVNEMVMAAQIESPSQATRSAATLMEVKQKLVRARADFSQNEKLAAKIEQRIKEVDSLYTSVSGERKIEEIEPWYVLDLLKTGLYGTRMDQTETGMVILDGVQGMVISLGFDKKGAGLTGSDGLLKGGDLISVSGKRTAVHTQNSGIYEVNLTQKTAGELIKLDPAWQRIGAMSLFSGNVYLVDVGARDIYVYPGLASGAGERRRWLKPGQEPVLAEVTDMVIDGDLWTLDNNGRIRRFQQGVQLDFAVTGLEKPWVKTVAIATTTKSEDLYILDQGNKRIVVLSKKGVYKEQYQWDGLAAAGDLAVDEVGGGLFILAGNQIYRIPMEPKKTTEE